MDGLILFCLDGDAYLVGLARERQLPFAALSLGFADQTIPAVGIDNVAAGRTAAEHLCELGHRRFAILAMQLNEGASGRRSMTGGYPGTTPSTCANVRVRTRQRVPTQACSSTVSGRAPQMPRSAPTISSGTST